MSEQISAAKLSKLEREIQARIVDAEFDVTQARKQLATTLVSREIGKPVRDSDITTARKTLAAAMQAHEDAVLVRDALAPMVAAAKTAESDAAQAAHSARIAAERQQATQVYKAAEVALDRDWRSLSRQELLLRGKALMALAPKAGCMKAFRDAVEGWEHRANGDVLQQLI
jgi:uncharacterized protein (DUF4415 family)